MKANSIDHGIFFKYMKSLLNYNNGSNALMNHSHNKESLTGTREVLKGLSEDESITV